VATSPAGEAFASEIWVPGEKTVLRDAKRFVLTGRDLLADAASARIWKERREPMPLETRVPGVFAAGDVRAGAMNRVASAWARARWWWCHSLTNTWH
jgi:thioredoxin reductase